MAKIHTIKSGHYEASIHTTGASLWSLRFKGEDYIPNCAEVDPSISYHGSVIAPWPNRIRDGKYQFAGRNFEVPVNESNRNNALHGFSAPKRWKIGRKTSSSVTLTTTVGGEKGYPAVLSLVVTYRLTRTGLTMKFSARNTSISRTPFGFAFHPYLKTPGDQSPALRITAKTVLLVDSERLLPLEEATVEGTEFDFRASRKANLEFLDHAFSDFDWDLEGKTFAQISGATGKRVSVTWDHVLPWIQIHRPNRPELQGALVVEPMTSPPDAFNSGRDVRVLEANEIFESKIQINCS